METKYFDQIHVKLSNDNSGIQSHDPGCGCCSSSMKISKEQALEEIDFAIEELNKLRKEIEILR